MKRLYLPVKFRNHGLHIWCFKCKKTVTPKSCKHPEQQRFQSRVYNPLTQTVICIKAHETRNAEEAFSLHQDYKAELKQNNYNIVHVARPDDPATPPAMVFLKTAAAKYSDFLQDIDVPPQAIKKLSPGYVRDQTRYLKQFIDLVVKREKRVSNFPVEAVSSTHVTDFHVWLKAKDLSQATYNASMKGCKYFFDWVIKNLKVSMRNPFEDVKMPEVHHDPEIIPIEEFEELLKLITPENGMGTKGKKGTKGKDGNEPEKINHYRPWLKKVFALALLTGERLDGVVLLRWSHIEGNFFKIPNFKVERIQKTVGKYYSYTPITADLAELLLQFDIKDDSGYIVEPGIQNRETLKGLISKAFTHFWAKTGYKREVTFKNLRKTYETLLTSALGERAMFVKHNDDKTAIKHYLDKKKLLEAAKDVRLYDISGWF